MTIEWASSAFKHGLKKEQILFAVSHPTGSDVVPGFAGDITRAFVGPTGEFADEYIEVLATLNRRTGRLKFIHAMPVTDIFRYLLGGQNNGQTQ